VAHRSRRRLPLDVVRGRLTKICFIALLRLAIGACAMSLAGCSDPWGSFERDTLNPGVRSNATPADVGLKFQRISIPNGSRHLDGFIVRADPSCSRTAAVLIFHGRGETVADWLKVQRRLHQSCISSMVFDYSGHGRSSPPGTINNLNADSIAAYSYFLRAFPRSERRCLLSHSLGGGPMLFAATQTDASPDCIVIASPFSSLRDMAVRGGMPRWLTIFMPDVWNNVQMAGHLMSPMLWVHSKTDTTIPIELGQAVYDAKKNPKAAIVVSGFNHNAIYDSTPSQIWTPVTEFILGQHPL
jgi:alpha-beta hydrolase superfamily lysophospholipase